MASRRVPLNLRKRAAVSCDLCKTRRRKCVRPPGSQNCELCIENGLSCIATIPRKQRSNPLVNDLPPRHKVMDQLISRLFPRVATQDLNQLIKLVDCLEKTNIEICAVDDEISVSANSIEIFSSANSPNQPSRKRIATPPIESPAPPSEQIGSYERILQNKSGTLSYFGASSSRAFVMQLRERLSTNDGQSLDSLQPNQRRLRKKFVADDYCSTMENSLPVDIANYQSHQEDDTLASSHFEVKPNRLQRFVESLPPRHEVDELVELFFVHVHSNMVLFHRPLFQTALEDLWVCHRKESEDVGWMVCCCVVFAFGCEHKILTSTDISSSQLQEIKRLRRKLIDLALGMVPQLMLSATLQSVQSFALLSLYLNTTNQRNASWIMIGCAIRMAISLGMHRGDELLLGRDIRLTPVEIELRKRVWWSLYIFEQCNSALFGRPAAVDDVEVTTDMPKESILDEGYHRPPGLMIYDVCLARIVGKIRRSQAARSQGPSVGEHIVQQLLQELDSWYDSLPQYLKFSESNQLHIFPSHFRQLVALQLRYQHARLLLARPFHLKILEQQSPVQGMAGSEMIRKFSEICVDAAFESSKLIYKLWGKGLFDKNLWLDGVFAYQCGMVLSLACLDTRRMLSPRDRKYIESTIESILGILHEFSPNRPMSRLVQIADDFSSIVKSMTLAPAAAGRHDLNKDQQLLPQLSHNSSAGDNFGQMQIGQASAEINPSVDVADMQPLWTPPLELQANNSGMDDVHNSNGSLPWELDSAEIIDYMLDCDFLQAFGFDGEDPCQSL